MQPNQQETTDLITFGLLNGQLYFLDITSWLNKLGSTTLEAERFFGKKFREETNQQNFSFNSLNAKAASCRNDIRTIAPEENCPPPLPVRVRVRVGSQFSSGEIVPGSIEANQLICKPYMMASLYMMVSLAFNEKTFVRQTFLFLRKRRWYMWY